jgi:RimJ/RimL family protein N-acetyltransferase
MSTTAGVLKEFDNALGGNDENDLPIAALVLVDADGSDAAVAGFWGHSHGRCEIGLDVARRFRGRGLAVPVTNAATRWILERGETPEYTCSVTNVRSQRVASSCGYLPAWSWAGVVTEPRPAAIPAG